MSHESNNHLNHEKTLAVENPTFVLHLVQLLCQALITLLHANLSQFMKVDL